MQHLAFTIWRMRMSKYELLVNYKADAIHLSLHVYKRMALAYGIKSWTKGKGRKTKTNKMKTYL